MKHLTALLACVLAAAVLAGCSPSEPTASTESAPVESGVATAATEESTEAPAEETESATEKPESTEEPAEESESGFTQDIGDNPSETASDTETSAPQPDDVEPVAVVEGEIPGGTLEVMPLQRSGDQVVLEVVLVIDPDAESVNVDECGWTTSATCYYSEESAGTSEVPNDVGDFTAVSLVDVVNGQRHLVLRQADDGECLCSRNVPGVYEPGGRYGFSASFAAPPEDVTSMTVEVPNFPAVPDVELR